MPGFCVGIDFGSSNLRVAVAHNGAVCVIPNEHGNLTTPSFVAFTNVARLIGDEAKSQFAKNRENTVFDVTRLIGRSFDDVKRDTQDLPFEIVDVNNKPMIKVQYKNTQRLFAPEEIAAMLFGKLKKIAETHLKTQVRDVVVAVAAPCSSRQRQAVRYACTIAGLNAIRIINATSAAGFAYCFQQKAIKPEHFAIVCDIGRSTCDVALMASEAGVCEMRATRGQRCLGGRNLDERIVQHFCAEFMTLHAIDLHLDARALCRLRIACEQAKRVLSISVQANIELLQLSQGIDFHSSLTRDCFENICAEHAQNVLQLLDRVMRDEPPVGPIETIVLTGGTTHMPSLQKKIFAHIPTRRAVCIENATVMGTALQAAVLNHQAYSLTRGLLLIDVTSLHTGVEGYAPLVVLGRNATMPHKTNRLFAPSELSTSHRDTLTVTVFEGDETQHETLGTLLLTGLSQDKHDVAHIDITFEIDVDGIAQVYIGNETLCNEQARFNSHDLALMCQVRDGFDHEDALLQQHAEAENKMEAELCAFEQAVALKVESGQMDNAQHEAALAVVEEVTEKLHSMSLADFDKVTKQLSLFI